MPKVSLHPSWGWQLGAQRPGPAVETAGERGEVPESTDGLEEEEEEGFGHDEARSESGRCTAGASAAPAGGWAGVAEEEQGLHGRALHEPRRGWEVEVEG